MCIPRYWQGDYGFGWRGGRFERARCNLRGDIDQETQPEAHQRSRENLHAHDASCGVLADAEWPGRRVARCRPW
jgi:hypothetical protein